MPSDKPVNVPWHNPYALPRRCTVGDNKRKAILHQTIMIEHNICWAVIEEEDGRIRKMKIDRVTLEPPIE